MGRSIKRVLLIASLIFAVLALCGCAFHDEQVTAVAEAIRAYTDYYVEVHNVNGQVKEQLKGMDQAAEAFTYSITARIPDYDAFDQSKLTLALPAVDFAEANKQQYAADARLALRQALETYAMEHPSSAYIDVPITVSTVKSGESWAGEIASDSKTELRTTIEALLDAALAKSEPIVENTMLLGAAQYKARILDGAFADEAFLKLCKVDNVSNNGDGTLTMTLSYPDPIDLYDAIGQQKLASYTEPFYGDTVKLSFSAADRGDLDVASLSAATSDILVSYDAEKDEYSQKDAKALIQAVNDAKSNAEAETSKLINEKWRVEPIDSPESGSVLYGKMHGNQVALETASGEFAHYYVRFFKLDTQDVNEEGELFLAVYMDAGQRMRIRLPAGYYRVVAAMGNSWYGEENRFGPEGYYFQFDSVLDIKSGFLYGLSLGVPDGNIGATTQDYRD